MNATNFSSPLRSHPASLPSQLSLTPGTTLFCDFDGPIVDVSGRYYATYQQALIDTQHHFLALGQMLPIQPLSQERFWLMKQNRVADSQIAHWSGLARDQITVFLERVQQLVNRPELLVHDRLQPGVPGTLAHLKAQGVRLVLVTLRLTTQVNDILRSYQLEAAVTKVYGTSEAGAAYQNHAEHKTELLARAIAEQRQRGFHTKGSWMIGDTEADILAGQAAGLPTLALTCGIRSKHYLQQFQPTQMQTDLATALVSQRPELVLQTA